MSMYMAMGKWAAMSQQQQEKYLDARGLEVIGYTLTGEHSTPESVEFGQARWQFRNADICEATGGWAVYGCTKDGLSHRVLEFGADKDDVIRLHSQMIGFPAYFRELWIMQFNLPDTMEKRWFSPVFFGASACLSESAGSSAEDCIV